MDSSGIRRDPRMNCLMCGEKSVKIEPEHEVKEYWFVCPKCSFAWTKALYGVGTYWRDKGSRMAGQGWFVVPLGCLPVFNERYED